MPRRGRCGRRGLPKAARVLKVWTALAVAASSSVTSAFVVGPKNGVALPSHLGTNGGGLTRLGGPSLLPVDAGVTVNQRPPYGIFDVEGESGSARALSHIVAHRARKCRVVPLDATSILLHDEPVHFGGRQPAMSVAARWLIARCILSRARASARLKVEVEASSNREAMKGRFDAVTIECDQLIFDNIQVSGGAKFEVLGLDLLAAGLLPGPMKRLRKLRRPCEVNCVAEFTDKDLMYSPSFRRLAECIVNTALRPKRERDGSSPSNNALDYLADEQRVHVYRVRLRGSKLAVEGEMESGPLFRVPFRYDVSMSISRDGQILYLREPTVYWGTPGGQVPIPMLPLQIFTVDLGDRARIEHLKIAKGRLEISGRFILSPITPLMVSRVTKRASIEHDLAETLSRVVCKTLRLRRE